MALILDGSSGVTFPAGGTGNPAGTVVGTSDTQSLTNKTIGSGYAGSTLTLSTAQNSTSGTNIDFTGIPSWAKRITVMFNGVSTNGTSQIQIQSGSGSVENTGYSSVGTTYATSSLSSSSVVTSGFVTSNASVASVSYSGTYTMTYIGSNTWVFSGMCLRNDGGNNIGNGVKTFSGTIDRIRITTVNGTDAFDAGSINIMWE